MVNTSNMAWFSASPLLEQMMPLLRELVWPLFWLVVIFASKLDKTGLISAIIGLINRVQLVKGWGVTVKILPPESPATIRRQIKERELDLVPAAPQTGRVNVLPPRV
jgi:hypothetical protein